MITIDLAYGVRRSVREELVKELNLSPPVPVWAQLSLGEHEGLAGVEEAVDGREGGMLAGYFKNPGNTKKVQSGTTRLQDEAVWRDKQRGFAVGWNMS